MPSSNAKIDAFSSQMAHEFEKSALDYKAIQESLMIHLDDLDDVTTTAVSGDYPPTGHAFIRDATHALPLAERLPPNHPHLQSINLLLRATSILSAIEHLIHNKQMKEPDNIIYDESIVGIHALLKNLAHALLSHPNQDKKFNHLEKDFFTELMPVLNRAGLTKGLKEPQDYADLLDHYRSLASLLVPAKTLVTKLNHIVGGMSVQHIETAHPITNKTDKQKAQIAQMKSIGKNDQRNFHSASVLAFQEASAAFADLLALDDRQLPAQARRNIGVTLKNGFVVHNEIIFPGHEHVEFWALRSGTLSYIGEGESDETCITYADENIKQVREAALSIAHREDVHMAMLLTDIFWNQQDQMVRVTKGAGALNNMSVSVLSTNWLGTFYPLDLDPKVVELAVQTGQTLPDVSADRANRATRINKVGDFIVSIGKNPKAPGCIILACCASGQDRTGTALEVATIKWIEDEYTKRSHIDVNFKLADGEIEKLRATGCHNAMLATLVAPGSAGLKKDSTPDQYFSDSTTQFYYRATADTNKNPLIDVKLIAKSLPPREVKELTTKKNLQEHYHYNSKIIMGATKEQEIKNALANWALVAIAYQNDKASNSNPLASVSRWLNKGTSEEEGEAIREMVAQAARALHASAVSYFSLTKLLSDIRLCINELKDEVKDKAKRGTVFEELNVLVTIASQQLEAIKNNHSQGISNSSAPRPS